MTTPLRRLLLLGLALLAAPRFAHAQDLQLHYDWRHSVDPRNNPHDFPAIAFKSFKSMPYGSFLLKLEADLDGERHDVSKGYVEITQTVRAWKAPVYLLGEYTGGLGLFDGGTGGYAIANAYIVGASYPFAWNGGWASIAIGYKHTALKRPSHDPQMTLYWGRPIGTRWSFATTGVLWSRNQDSGDDYTAGLRGKRASALFENEIWWRAFGQISVGSEVRVSRNVYATDGRVVVYPTTGVRYFF